MKLLQQMGKCENQIMTVTRRSKETTGAMRKRQLLKRPRDLKATSERRREGEKRRKEGETRSAKQGKADYEFANCPRQDKSTAPGSSSKLRQEMKSADGSLVCMYILLTPLCTHTF